MMYNKVAPLLQCLGTYQVKFNLDISFVQSMIH